MVVFAMLPSADAQFTIGGWVGDRWGRPCERLGTCRPRPQRPTIRPRAKLGVKNCRNEDISFSVGYLRGNEWVSKGHYTASAGRSNSFTFPSESSEGTLY